MVDLVVDVNARSMVTATYATTLPGAPDGEYVVIRFDTSFENAQGPRRKNGVRRFRGVISEHSYANAIDLTRFVFRNGKSVTSTP
jgi:hypothetical protein